MLLESEVGKLTKLNISYRPMAAITSTDSVLEWRLGVMKEFSFYCLDFCALYSKLIVRYLLENVSGRENLASEDKMHQNARKRA